MKLGSLVAVALGGILISVSPASAGCWHGGGGWGGGWHGGGGWCGPGWGGWGWGGPAINIGFAPPPVVYAPAPQPVYYQQVNYVRSAPSPLATAQIRLARLGYYRGPIDGQFGPYTSNALRNYQIDYGLPVTGRPDGRTMASLGV